ncbi:MAG: hypothetical protein J6X88_00720 [Bacteroidales bacterium]|nr:hypothetical protein [Bacteroidales bacterium]MBP5677992.1 hypothetical protein [Bacteroidales bacterium]
MNKKEPYNPPRLTVATVRTEHCFESAPLDLKMGFEERTRSAAWGNGETQNSEEIEGQRWYY